MHPGRVIIIILNWNGLDDTINCIDSCKRLAYKNFNIVVVDNNSSDLSAEKLHELYPDIKIIKNEKNMGYSGGNNVGIEYAIKTGSEYIWLLNNDVVVYENSLSELLSVFNRKSIGMVSPVILQYHNPELIDFSGGEIDKDTGVIKHIGRNENIEILNKNLILDSDFLTGCALLMKVEMIKQVGLLNEDYFLYCEDVDYSIRAKIKDFRLVVSPSSFVLHKLSNSTRKEKGLITFYKTRNTLILLSRFFLDQVDWSKRLTLDLKKVLEFLKVFNLRGAFNIFIAYIYWMIRLVGPKKNPKHVKKYRYSYK